VTQALAAVIARTPLPEAQLQEIIDGMEMDLDRDRYADFAALEVYCHRVAGVVGLLSAQIFGATDPRTAEYAHALGIAFQLTNIVRDVGEDARRGRIYLPQDELARFGVTANDIFRARESDAFRALMEFQVERALAWYDRAFALLPAADRRAQRPGLVMAAIYRTLLVEIRADGCRVLTTRTSLTPLRKLWLAWKTWVTA
jgi:phytoene synthase